MRKLWLPFLLLLVLMGCGAPKADVPIFMMPANGLPAGAADKLKASLQAKVGDKPTIEINGSPIFSLEKLIVEIAAGENGIIVVSYDQFKAMGEQKGYAALDSVIEGSNLKPEDVQQGYLETTDNGKTEKHLYGLPLENTKWFKEQNLNGKDLIAFIPMNVKNKDNALKVMKSIAEK